MKIKILGIFIAVFFVTTISCSNKDRNNDKSRLVEKQDWDFDFDQDNDNDYASFDNDLEDLEDEFASAGNIQTRGGGAIGIGDITGEAIAIALARLLDEDNPQPIWQNTRPPKGRNILYLIPHKMSVIEYGGLAATLFFNMTNRMDVRASSLLDLNSINQEAVKDILDSLFQGSQSLTVEEIDSLLPLFTKMVIQERRFGALIQGGFVKGPFSVQLHSALQLSARNFWLSNRDSEAIEAITQRIFPRDEIDESELFRIRYGLSDTRLKVGVNMLNMTDFQTDFGFEAIIPTSRLFVPKVKLTTNLENTVTDINALQESFLQIIRNVRDHLLYPTLGNGGHFGFGCYMEAKAKLPRDTAQLWLRMSYNKLFPIETNRLTMFKRTIEDPSDFAGDLGDDPEGLQGVIQLIREFFFPSAFNVTVYPGGVFNLIASVTKEWKHWQTTLGYDFFYQQKERIKAINNTSLSFADLRIEDAESPSKGQHKVFFEANYLQKFKKINLGVGLGGDVTVRSRNLGYDWTVYLKTSFSF